MIDTVFRDRLRNFCSRTDFQVNSQYVHTPYSLCYDIVEKLIESGADLTDKIILTFNLEIVETLIYDFAIKRENILFVTDCIEKSKIIKHPHFIGVNVILGDYLSLDNMKFDIIIGNPPYNISRDKCNGNTLWPDFVKKSLSFLKDDGYLCLVHPPGWRKPESESDLWPLLFNKILYLSIQDKKSGEKVFGASTRFDWYVAKNSIVTTPIEIRGDDGVTTLVNLKDWSWLPSSNFEVIQSIIASPTEEKIRLIQSTDYRTDKPWVSRKETKKFKHPVFLSNTKKGIRLCYSSKKLGHFDMPKVICNGGEFIYPINDFDGKYAINAHSFGIEISSNDEGDKIIQALNSDKFQSVLLSTKWSNYQIDYRMFKSFKKNFWKEFI